MCFDFIITKKFEVEDAKESSVFIYDYYSKGNILKK